ncbi:MAG: sulfatase-like hydrolase/transferase [Verrucomicrobiota bacterium]
MKTKLILGSLVAVLLAALQLGPTAEAQTVPAMNTTITLKSVSEGKYVSVDADNNERLEAKTLESDVIGQSSINTAEERFFIEPVPDTGDTFRLKSAQTGFYVTVNPSDMDKIYADGAGPDNGPDSQFQWEYVSPGIVALRSVGQNATIKILGNQKTLRARSGNSANAKSQFEWSVIKPNIILVYVDDWGWNGTSVRMDEFMPNSGFNGEIADLAEMPNLEAIADNGTILRNAYGSPQCSPARASTITGQSNARNGYTVNLAVQDDYDLRNRYKRFPVIGNGSDNNLDIDSPTIPFALDGLGYDSALFGKWHLGNNLRLGLTNGPLNAGFDEAPDGNTGNDEGKTVNGDFLPLDDGSQADRDAHPDFYLYGPKRTENITSNGLTFMDTKASTSTPFFLMLSYYAHHDPQECRPSSRAKFQNKTPVVEYNLAENGSNNPLNIKFKRDPAVWLGMLYELDLAIGDVRQKVRDLKIEDNTYVVVVSDNGYRHSFFVGLTGQPQPLHAAKWFVWEAGIRVPMIVEGPGVAKFAVTNQNVVNYDLLPTFVDWAGGNPNDETEVEGVSLATLLTGETPSFNFEERPLYFHFPTNRTGIPSSSIIRGYDVDPGPGVDIQTFKMIYFYDKAIRSDIGGSKITLFNLEDDIREETNLYDGVDPFYTPIGDQLETELFAYLNDLVAAGHCRPLPIENTAQNQSNNGITDFATYDEFAFLVDSGDGTPLISSDQKIYSAFNGTRALQEDELDFTNVIQGEDYSDMKGVKIKSCTDLGGGECLTAISNNDWVRFSDIEFSANGVYDIDFRTASAVADGSTAGTITILWGGEEIGTIDIEGTGSNDTWETFSTTVDTTGLDISTAKMLRFNVSQVGGSFRLNWFEFPQ